MSMENWEDRTTPELYSDEAISGIEGANLLINRFGQWPTFEDGEVLDITLDRGNFMQVSESGAWHEFVQPSLSATFYVFDCRFSLEAPERRATIATIRFGQLDAFEINGFNHQNPIIGLGISLVYSERLKTKLFKVDWGGAVLPHEVSLACAGIRVVSVEPLG
jgi:hypothetical protein